MLGWREVGTAFRLVGNVPVIDIRTQIMPEPSEPPPSKTLLAAAAGGFGGAILGVVAATMMMGGDDSNGQAANIDNDKPAVHVIATADDIET